ncbi:unnamed protein product [Toxocara canis]|uniref:Ac81-like protein n=1 Tax=Toxocara canis TaxID=6265 RepID=A0A183UIS8_TOXCA|nr:unnamed protein product [Toxocara canis]
MPSITINALMVLAQSDDFDYSFIDEINGIIEDVTTMLTFVLAFTIVFATATVRSYAKRQLQLLTIIYTNDHNRNLDINCTTHISSCIDRDHQIAWRSEGIEEEMLCRFCNTAYERTTST